MPLPKSKQPPAQPPAVSAAAMRAHAKHVNATDVPALLAALADRRGVTPADLADVYRSNPDLAREDGIKPDALTPAVVREAGGLFRAGISAALRRVDEHNARVLASHPELAETHESINGEVRVAKRKPVADDKPKPPRRPAVEILGYPSTEVIRACARLKLSFGDTRLALDELGGLGVSDATVRRLMAADGPIDPKLLSDVTAELLGFRGKGKPDAEIKQERRAEQREERARQVVPMSAPTQVQTVSRFRR